MIKQFKGQYAFLSNMFETKVTYMGIVYNSSENLYQAFKTCELAEREMLAHVTPYESKAYWKGTKIRNPDFMALRLWYMEEALRAKFEGNRALRKMLIATGDAEIVEGNWWNDTFWGINDGGEGVGSNHLGQLLMKLREEYK